MPSATATLSEFLRPNQPEIVQGERRLARGCPWSEPVGPRHGSRTTASQRASSSGARLCLIPGHLGSSRLISRPISGRRSRVGRGAANLRESLKRRLRGHFGEEQRRPGPTPAPRRSLPSSSSRTRPAAAGRRTRARTVRRRLSQPRRPARPPRGALRLHSRRGGACPGSRLCGRQPIDSRDVAEMAALTTTHGLCVGRSLHGRRANLGDAAPLPRDCRVRAHRGASHLRQEYLTDRQ